MEFKYALAMIKLTGNSFIYQPKVLNTTNIKHIKRISADFCKDELLKKSQNQNQSFNDTVWNGLQKKQPLFAMVIFH